jgi:predicted O-methyltransferase YrrM
MSDSIKITHQNIQGWCDFEDLYTQIIRENLKDGDTAVEVGAWLGRSTAFFMSELARQNKNVRFYCVDLWGGPQDDNYMNSVVDANNGSILHIFEKNMKDCGFEDKYSKVVGDSAKSAEKFADKSIDFCFIDGNHTYDFVKKDIQAWIPKVKTGGIIAGHDIDRESVTRAVQESFGSNWKKVSERCWIAMII